MVATARTAGAAALALGVFGSIITAAGSASGDVQPAALQASLAAAVCRPVASLTAAATSNPRSD
ncbi:hypothetical protein ACWDTA_34210, partial [Nocardia niigatensis]